MQISRDTIAKRWADSGIINPELKRSDRLKLLSKFYREDSIRRLRNAELCKNDVGLQALVMEHCKNNILDWVVDWVWTYDPRRSAYMPLIPFPKQADYLLWRLERRANNENGLTEKSRDAGITWLNIVHHGHCWLFEHGFKGAFGSNKEDKVDRIGDPDSIFEKIRQMLRYLPKWMMPHDFEWHNHDNFKRLINPNMESTITGEAGDQMGRGGRSSLYDLDEAAFVERPQKVDAAISGNSDVIYYTSSANGIANLFYKKRTTYPSKWIFRFHWRDDPRKDEEWYAIQKQKLEPVTVASEIDIDYSASVEGIYIPNNWVMAAVDFPVSSSGPIYAGLDVAGSGKNSTVLTIRQGAKVLALIEWNEGNTTITAYNIVEEWQQWKFEHLTGDADGIGDGVFSTFATIPDLPFTFTPAHGSGSSSDRIWPGEGRTSKQKFYNYRAETYGLLKDRFKKTFEVVQGIASYPDDELISIPNHPQLIAQISQPQRKYTASGKVLLESKDDMRSRGIESPDFADSLKEAMMEPVISEPFKAPTIPSDRKSNRATASEARSIFS